MSEKSRKTKSEKNTDKSSARANWRDPNAYPPRDTTDALWWAWEFLRRNKDYEHDADNMLTRSLRWQLVSAPGIDDDIGEYVCTPSPPKSVKTYGQYVDHFKKLGRTASALTPLQHFRMKWHVKYALSAKDSYAVVSKPPGTTAGHEGDPAELLKRFRKMKFRIDSTRATFQCHSALNSILCTDATNPASDENQKRRARRAANVETRRISLFPNHVMLRFHLDLELAPQLRHAQQLLPTIQKKYCELYEEGSLNMPPFDNLSYKPKDLRNYPHTLHYLLRTYDAACEAGIQSEPTLSADLASEVTKKYCAELDTIADAANENTNKNCSSRSAPQSTTSHLNISDDSSDNSSEEISDYSETEYRRAELKRSPHEFPKFDKKRTMEWYEKAWILVNTNAYINVANPLHDEPRDRTKEPKARALKLGSIK